MAREPGGPARSASTRCSRCPDDAEITRGYVDAARVFTHDSDDAEGLLGRIHWLLRVLARPELDAVHETALRDVGRCCARLLEEPAGREDLVREVFGLLRSADLPRTRALTDLVTRLGCAAMESGDPGLAATLIDEMLGLEFAYPEFSGFTSEWGVRVNPAHLRHIRTYLRDHRARTRPSRGAWWPRWWSTCGSAACFIADTDLFQRDVSALLGCEIRPVFLEVKQLLRVFPVYFREIGAEGRLRETSTRLDEIDHRQRPALPLPAQAEPRGVQPAADHLRRRDPALLGDRRHRRAARLRARRRPRRSSRRRRRACGRSATTPPRSRRRPGAWRPCWSSRPTTSRPCSTPFPPGDPLAREKISLIFQVREELRRKYALDHSDVIGRLHEFRRVDAAAVRDLEAALARDDSEHRPGSDARSAGAAPGDRAARPGETTAVEDIYLKRHIAAGIPSMYGSYREERFEAVGLTFRLESLGDRALRARHRRRGPRACSTATGCGRSRGWLHQLQRALRIDGYRAQGLAHCLAMLDEALEDPDTARRAVPQRLPDDLAQHRDLDPGPHPRRLRRAGRRARCARCCGAG